MLPLHQVENYFQRIPHQLKEIVLELRNIVIVVAPDAVETIRWRGLVYHHGDRGGIISAGICQIQIRGDQVWLGFIHGAYIADPKHLLAGKMKAKRIVKLESYDNAPWDDLKLLIEASANFDPRKGARAI
jgi:hypothetical protein